MATPAKLSPIMSENEQKLFKKYIPHGEIALEFGAGGSTRIFFESEIYRLYSVESDNNWINQILLDPVLSFFYQKNRLFLLHANIGPISDTGNPASNEPEYRWLSYHQTIWSHLPYNDFSFVLIDGRFRVASALQALLRCNTNTTYYFHDFTNRSYYHCINNFIDIVETADTAIVYKAKSNINYKDIAMLIQNYSFDTR